MNSATLLPANWAQHICDLANGHIRQTSHPHAALRMAGGPQAVLVTSDTHATLYARYAASAPVLADQEVTLVDGMWQIVPSLPADPFTPPAGQAYDQWSADAENRSLALVEAAKVQTLHVNTQSQDMTRKEIMTLARKLAPWVHIQTIWENDEDGAQDTSGLEDEHGNISQEDWQCWQSEVCATAIINGNEVSGSGYLGGTWEKAGDVPEESNPEISGYFSDMLDRALDELSASIQQATGEDAEQAEQAEHLIQQITALQLAISPR